MLASILTGRLTTAHLQHWWLRAQTAVRNVINICLWSTQRGLRPCENKTTTLTRPTTAESGAGTERGFPWQLPSPVHPPSALLFFLLSSSHSLSAIKSRLVFLSTLFSLLFYYTLPVPVRSFCFPVVLTSHCHLLCLFFPSCPPCSPLHQLQHSSSSVVSKIMYNF